MAIARYDPRSESIHQNKLPLHMDLLRETFQSYKEKTEWFIKLFIKEIIIDIPLQAIVLCIPVFNPAGEELTNRQHLSKCSDIYLHTCDISLE